MNRLRTGPPDVAALLSNTEWLSRLAGHLVRDRDDARDSVQETWLAALRQRPRDPEALRPWLGQILRNTIRRRARTDGRRRAREQAAAAGEPVEPAAASLDRLELQRQVTNLLAALEEPFRTTIVLRYFEDRSSVETARLLGVPEGTVRWRTKEALDRLRRGLDEKHGGDRRAWCATLAPLAAPSRGMPAISPLVGLAAAALVAVIGATGALIGVRSARRPPVATETSAMETSAEASAAGAPPRAWRPPVFSAAVAAPADAGAAPAASLAPAARETADRRLKRARDAWDRSCPIAATGGLCLRPSADRGQLCPGTATAGRLEAVPRDPGLLRAALDDLAALAADEGAPEALRTSARLHLAEAKIEGLLGVAPLRGLSMSPSSPSWPAENKRFTAWFNDVARRLTEATKNLEPLAAAEAPPATRAPALLRLAQTLTQGARLFTAVEIPTDLVDQDRWGNRPKQIFCNTMADKAEPLLEKARKALRACLADLPAPAADPCRQELERLPPPRKEP